MCTMMRSNRHASVYLPAELAADMTEDAFAFVPTFPAGRRTELREAWKREGKRARHVNERKSGGTSMENILPRQDGSEGGGEVREDD